MRQVLLGLGSNLGSREENIRAALQRLAARGVSVVRVSSLWESEPVPPGQPTFLNAAALVECRETLPELLVLVKEVEVSLGRRAGPRWGPRVIDVDILHAGDEAVDSPALTVPHPRMFERSFVLAPVLEILERGSPLYELCRQQLQAVGVAGVRRLEGWGSGPFRGRDDRRAGRHR